MVTKEGKGQSPWHHGCLPAGEGALPRGPQAKLLARRRSTATRPAGQAACPQAKHCHAARRPSCLPAGEALPRGPQAKLLARRRSTATRPAGQAACPQAKHCHAARRPSCLPAGEALPHGPQPQHPDTAYVFLQYRNIYVYIIKTQR